jgi:hypothetical protein
MSLRDFFTADRIDLISEYQEKWRRVYLDTQPIDRIKAAAAVQQAYRVMGKPEPEIIFCPSPRAALDRLQIYISQVDDPPPSVPMSADEARDYHNSFQFRIDGAWIIFKSIVAWIIYKSIGKGQKVRLNTVFKLLEDLENSQFTSLQEYIGTILPKNLTSQPIVEYDRLVWDSTFRKIEEQTRRNFPEQEQEDVSINFSSMSSMFERQTPWFPGKGLVSIFLLKKMSASSILTNIKIIDESGVPNDTTEFYNSISAAELAFLSKNPPICTWHLTKSCTWIDFAISVLNFPYNREKWWALKELTEQCGWIFAMSKFCIVCDRPANNN